jgi:CRP/FNR family transcriptional regulator
LLLEAPSGVVTATHQQMADELGSAREVVSRQLKEFERSGWIRLMRGSVEVLDRTALQKLA